MPVLLRITGSIDSRQFFPAGDADADTVHVHVGPGAFAVASHPTGRFTRTRVFDRARVRGRIERDVSSAAGAITVRLQGLDAPELHYSPGSALRRLATRVSERERELLAMVFRQPHGIDVTTRVGSKLGENGSRVPCVLETRVDTPGDVFDTYGRCVADVFVGRGTRTLHLNDWLLREGLALPCLYSSMARDEIERVVSIARAARAKELGVWRSYRARVPRFAWEPYDAALRSEHARDTGPLSAPKIFRLQAAWALARRAGLFRGAFERFVTRGPLGTTHVHRTSDFLAQGAGAAPLHALGEFFRDETLTVAPDALVFRDAPSVLVDRRGRPVTRW